MFEYDNGLYSAQSLTFSYWGDFEDDPETAVAGLQGELAGMGFHVYVEKDGRRFSSNLTEEDEECLEQMDVRESLERCDSLTLTSVSYTHLDVYKRQPVSYWMPFNGNIGMHDASWRSSFGGDIYKTNGSHGCINLPVSVAQELYGYVEKGTPVICYYLPGTEAVKEDAAASGEEAEIQSGSENAEVSAAE